MPRPDHAVDHGLRLADRGACVPWDALAAIERAQADAAGRRSLATDRGASRPGPRSLARRARSAVDRLGSWARRAR